MTPSDNCYAITRKAEGCKLTAYQDGGGVWTIGWGHTSGVHPGMTITAEQAQAFLEQDMALAADVVNRLAMPCTQNQFDALVDFEFNEGQGHFATSTLLNLHRARQYAAAAAEFGKWIYCDGKIEAGLVKRRAQEAHLYLGEPL